MDADLSIGRIGPVSAFLSVLFMFHARDDPETDRPRRRHGALRPGFRAGSPALPPRRLDPGAAGAFIRALAECGSVRDACKRVGMSLASAYRLYRHAGAAGFRRACNAAQAAVAGPRRPPPSPKASLRPAPVPGLSPEGSARLAGRLRDAIAGSWQASTSSTYSTSAEGPGSGGPLAGAFVRVRRTIRLRIPAGDLARPLVSCPPAPIEGRQPQRGR